MSEKAILPLNATRITAGYKNEAYRRALGFAHYGTDMADLKRECTDVYAPFKMKVIKAGYDALMGGTIIAVSVEEVDIHHGPKKGKRRVAVRMAHLAKTFVEDGDVIGPEDHKIAEYGKTGRYGNSPHLHIEVDTDIEYPEYSPALKRNSDIWKAGRDSTINPMDVFKVDAAGSRGYKQTFHYSKASGSLIGDDDRVTLGLDGLVKKAIKI